MTSTTTTTTTSSSHSSAPQNTFDILVAVDGTCSRKDVNLPRDEHGKVIVSKIGGPVTSHVWNFYHRFEFTHGHKYYFDGPDTLGFKTGHIIDHGLERVKQQLHAALDSRKHRITTNNTTLAQLGIRVVLVGHSRGGLIVMMIARHLQALKLHPKIPHVHVHFMGLYDAVDRHIGEGRMQIFGGAKIPGNVLEARHALRDTTVSSWKRGVIAFGNTGEEAESGCHLIKEVFTATHSSMGGAPWQGDQPSQITEQIDIKGSNAVGAWMLNHAKKCDLRFKG